jgi:hypothetical protein
MENGKYGSFYFLILSFTSAVNEIKAAKNKAPREKARGANEVIQA